VFAWMAKEAVGAGSATTVVVGLAGLLVLVLGIASSSLILTLLGGELVLLAVIWIVRELRRALVARGMRERFPDS
jgi:hypothetical protein